MKYVSLIPSLVLLCSMTVVLEADTLTFQAGVFPNSGTTDTWLQGASGNANQGNSTVLEWDGEDFGGQNFLLLRFDEIFGTLPGQIQPTDVITVRMSGHDHVHSPDIAVAQEGNDHASAIVESRASGTGVYDHRLAVGELQEGGVSLTYVQENHLQLALSDDSPPHTQVFSPPRSRQTKSRRAHRRWRR